MVHHSAGEVGGVARLDKLHRGPQFNWDELGYHFVIGNGSDTPNGAIEIIDPRAAAGVYKLPSVAASGIWVLQPEPGTMLLWPSWLRHSVLPYVGEGPRISIAFNLRVSELTFTDARGPEGPKS